MQDQGIRATFRRTLVLRTTNAIGFSVLLATLGGCGSTSSLRSGEHRSDAARTSALSDSRLIGDTRLNAVDRSHSKWPARRDDDSTDEQRAIRDAEARASFCERSGSAPLVMTFDEFGSGQILSHQVVEGVDLRGGLAPLLVVAADETSLGEGYENVADGTAYRLHATSGRNILSPGGSLLAAGPNPAVEDDDVTIRFNPPVAAVGFDFLTPSLDGMSFTSVTVIGIDGEVLHSGDVSLPHAQAEGTAYPPSGSVFWGFVAENRVISEVRIDERDGDPSCPDANIGIDSIRFAPAPGWLAADLDEDGAVTPRDLAVVLDDWKKFDARTPHTQLGWWRGDVNRDRVVDENDAAIVSRHLAG
jgi:hypothetical protein